MISTEEQDIGGDAPIALYRLYDATGAVLYIGITHSPAKRFAEHAVERPWWSQVARKTVAWCDGKAEAAIAEALAIRDEKPVYNAVHPKPWLKRKRGGGTKLRNFRISDSLWVAVQAQAARDGRTVTDVVLAFFRAYVGQV